MSSTDRKQPPAVDGVLVDLDALPAGPALQHPPALRSQVSCLCGKGSVAAHGPFSCDEVLAIRARVEYGARLEALPWWRRPLADCKPVGWPR